jgi:3-deoxy-7-phosphoheptulonate synthase
MYSTLEEWLNCAEYILSEGSPDVSLCERGIRTFEKYTRNTLDLSAVPAIKELTHLPIIIDPTHSTGRISLIGPMCMAAAAAGADGLMVEVHYKPQDALCDADQALTPDMFSDMMRRLRPLKTFLDQLPSRSNKSPESTEVKK